MAGTSLDINYPEFVPSCKKMTVLNKNASIQIKADIAQDLLSSHRDVGTLCTLKFSILWKIHGDNLQIETNCRVAEYVRTCCNARRQPK